jgi:putative serine protease PepD
MLRRSLPALLAAAAIAGGGTGAAVVATAGSPRASSTTTPAVLASATTSATPAASAIYASASPGVVDVKASVADGTSEGAGFEIDAKGDIVTNEHVVDGASTATVTFSDGAKATAQVVGESASKDIAVLRVRVAASRLHPLTLASASSVHVGDGVLAIGSPFGLEQTLTAGIVSATGRSISAPDDATIRGAIQTDAAINPGNSGGPLLDAEGDVIGVNAQIASGSDSNAGVGFAISSATVRQVVSQVTGAAV